MCAISGFDDDNNCSDDKVWNLLTIEDGFVNIFSDEKERKRGGKEREGREYVRAR